jgi:hypothetical protein
MKRIFFTLSAIALLPALAAAQSDDAAYCGQLSSLAQRFVSGGGGDGRSFPDLATNAAIEECRKGNYASSIPYLEKRLRDSRVTLPKRS